MYIFFQSGFHSAAKVVQALLTFNQTTTEIKQDSTRFSPKRFFHET